jgi:hypothetical protein
MHECRNIYLNLNVILGKTKWCHDLLLTDITRNTPKIAVVAQSVHTHTVSGL